MSDNRQDETPDLGGVPLGTTGRQLREAREARGWDIHSLSDSLHLRPAVLTAIEEGHYQGVPELFLKGYVRSYARLLGMDGNKLMPQLESELAPLRQEEAQRQTDTPVHRIEEKKRKKRRVAFFALILVLALLLVIGLVWFQTSDLDEDLSESAAVESEEVDPSPSPADEVFAENGPRSLELVTEGSASPDTSDELEEPSASNDASPETSAGGLDGPANPQPAAIPETAPVTSGESAPANPVSSDPNPGVADGPAAPGPVPATTRADPAASEVGFEIRFRDDCWIEVRDANGDRIYAALRGDGDTLSRQAVAPLTFVIGNIDAIASFTFAGEPVAVEDYPAWNGRAEITLSAESSD